MRHFVFMFLSALGLTSGLTATANTTEDNDAVKLAVQKVRDFFQGQKTAQNIPGLSYVIVHGDKILLEETLGYADLGEQRPVSSETLYRVGSITKVFTATMLMQLQERSLLQLDDSVKKHLAEFNVASDFAGSKPITLRQLVSHTSGLTAEAPLDYWQTLSFPSEKTLLDSIDGIKLKHAQLAKIYYSNLGFSVLGAALTRASGKAYGEYLASEIFSPLAMSSTSVRLSSASESKLAKGYVWDGAKHIPVPNFEMGAIAPAGAIYSTASDMARFVSLQFKGYRSVTAQVLGSASLREMHSPVFINDNWSLGVGVGWFIKRIGDHKVIYHAGGLPGYTSDLTLVLDRELGIALFTNTAVDTTKLNKEAMEILLPAFDAYYLKEENRIAGVRPEWDKYVGEYSLPGGLPPSRVFFSNNRMLLATPATQPGSESMFFPTNQENRFVLRRGDMDGEEVMFRVDGSGAVEALEVGGYVLTRNISR